MVMFFTGNSHGCIPVFVQKSISRNDTGMPDIIYPVSMPTSPKTLLCLKQYLFLNFVL